MHLRLFSSRMLQYLPRYQPVFTRNFESCVCTMQRNLIPAANFTAVHHQPLRFKRTGPKRSKISQDKEDDESDAEDEKDDSKQQSREEKLESDAGTKIIVYKLDSPRVDRLLRKALNISVKKLEDLFYDKKIQVNEKTLVKKSQKIEERDIITVPLEDSAGKTARGALIEVLEVIENESSYSVKVSRNKNTLVSV